jgi:hypothetical protein
MKTFPYLFLLLLCGCCIYIPREVKITSSPFPAESISKIIAESLHLGMSEEAVQNKCGQPPEVAHTLVIEGYILTQWIYAGGVYFYFNNGRLVAWDSPE